MIFKHYFHRDFLKVGDFHYLMLNTQMILGLANVVLMLPENTDKTRIFSRA
ncbi:MAG: hypothetical protein ACTSXU_04355 [Promethearchaeota archaeon]